jgi:hypothetical protein
MYFLHGKYVGLRRGGERWGYMLACHMYAEEAWHI